MKGPTANVVKSNSLKSFLGVRKGAGPRKAKSKQDHRPVASTLVKTAAVDKDIVERLARAANASKARSNTVVSPSLTESLRPSKTPERPVRQSSLPPGQASQTKGKGVTVAGVGADDAFSPSKKLAPSRVSSLSESNKTTRRRLFADAPASTIESTSSVNDPVAHALAAQQNKRLRSTAGSIRKAVALREKYGHLLHEKEGTAIASSSSLPSSTGQQADGRTFKNGNEIEGSGKSALRGKYAHLLASPLAKNKARKEGGDDDEGPSGAIDEKQARFRYLLDDNTKSLRLPFKYQVLLAKFLALETTLMIQQHCRGRTVTFESARPSVERTCSKAFTMCDLARIMTVYPNAYDLAVIHRNGMSPQGTRGTVDGYYNGRSTVRIFANFGSEHNLDECMKARSEAFTQGLLEIAKAGHHVFLSSLSPPVSITDDELSEWHPEFKNDRVPDIKPAALPEGRREHVPSAAEILSRRKNMSPTVKRALEHVVAKQSIPGSPVKKRRLEQQRGQNQLGGPKQAGDTGTPNDTATSGVGSDSGSASAPMTLLERIKLKERLNKERQMRTEQEANGASKYKKMWECAMIIRAFARSKRKTALVFTECVTAITRCIKTPMAEARIKECLVALSKAVPAWCQVKKVQDKYYFTMVPDQYDVLKKFMATQNAM